MRMDLAAVAGHDPVEITDQPRDAAVIAPVIERPSGHALLFIKRAEDLGEHPGQMGFPGGGHEPGDEGLEETALRESKEEIGLESGEAEVVGQLDDIRTVTEYAVTPFVARIPDRTYHPDGVEVTEVAVLSLSALTDEDNYECEEREHPYYGDIVIHYFHVDGYTVWGATGRILADLLELTTDWRAPVRIDRDPV